jgi:Holliday junction resolvasome RuvABC endonuclease subunit
MVTVLGIDPGLSGAVALLRVDAGTGTARLSWLWDVTAEVAQAARDADLVVMETQRASPQMGVASAFSLGRSVGVVIGALEATGQSAHRVEPAVWRGAFGLTSKEDGVDMARRVIGEPTRALRHDEADAILLAWWGWRAVLSKAG